MKKSVLLAMSDAALNKVVVRIANKFVPRKVTNPISSISQAWRILEYSLDECGGMFRAQENGWACCVGEDDDDEVSDKSPSRAICLAFLVQLGDLVTEKGFWEKCFDNETCQCSTCKLSPSRAIQK